MSNLDPNAPITREALYGLVWSEPMLNVALKFGVSSSYMARVCTALNVPRPSLGYWSKVAYGQTPPKSVLPQARTGDQLIWMKGQAVNLPRPVRSRGLKKQAEAVQRKPAAVSKQQASHPLIFGAKRQYEKGRFTHELGYLRPDKRTLADIIVTPGSWIGHWRSPTHCSKH